MRKKVLNYLNRLLRYNRLLLVSLCILFVLLTMLSAFKLDYHWLIIIPQLIFFKIYVLDANRIYQSSRAKYKEHILNKEFTSFALISITTSSLLFTVFSNVFFENDKIFDTIRYSLQNPKTNLEEFYKKISEQNTYICFDLSGSWESSQYQSPDWYDVDFTNNLASEFNIENFKDADTLVTALELAKIKSLKLIEDLTKREKRQLSIHYYKKGKLLHLTDHEGNKLINCKDRKSVNALAQKLYQLESSNSKTDFEEIFKQISSKILDKELSQTLIMFSDFVHYNPEKKKTEHYFDTYLNEFYLSGLNVNCVKSKLFQTVDELEKLNIDSLIKESAMMDRAVVYDIDNGFHPHDLLNDVSISSKNIEFYYDKEFKSTFEIQAPEKNKKFAIDLIEPTKFNSGLFYQVHLENDSSGRKPMDHKKSVEIPSFNGKDILNFFYDGGPLNNPPVQYVLEMKINDHSNSRKYKIKTLFLKKIPEWAAILFLVNVYFLILTPSIRLLLIAKEVFKGNSEK